MRVFVAGASGAIGTRLVPQLIDAGHEVIGTSTSPARAERVRAQGAKPIALDLLDARAVRKAVLEAEPDAIVHEATALANVRFSRNFDRTFAQTNRLRTEGTDALLAAAREARVHRFVAQSFATMRYVREGGMVKTEDDPLDPAPAGDDARGACRDAPSRRGGHGRRRCRAPLRRLLRRRQRRAGRARAQAPVPDRRRRRRRLLIDPPRGRRRGDRARARARRTGVFNIVDDEPAPVREWLPVLAEALGAKPPRHFPAWLARLFAGEAAVMMGTESRGASNAKAKRELGWEPALSQLARGLRGRLRVGRAS